MLQEKERGEVQLVVIGHTFIGGRPVCSNRWRCYDS